MNRKALLVLALSAFVVVGSLAFKSAHDYFGKENAKELIRLLYDFGNVKELDNRYDKIDKLTNDEVYKQITSLDRTLRAYLKLEGKPSSVNILRATNDYVIYELDCEALTSGRKFMLLYETDLSGKIVDAKEVEIVDFI